MKARAGIAALVGAALLAAGCGSSSSSGTTTTNTPTTSGTTTSGSGGGVTVSTASVKGLGTVLVDSQGHTLYLFMPDKHTKVTCTGACATVWPPLKLPAGSSATASGQAKSSMLGSDPNPAGGRVVTYAGWPLYTYVADTAPGSAIGQATNLNGGFWYVISPTGMIIHAKP